MIPQLRRFYHDPHIDWWDMPEEELEGYLEEMPRIQAREALMAIQIAMAGSPSQSDSDSRTKQKIISDLQRQTMTKNEYLEMRRQEKEYKEKVNVLQTVFALIGSPVA